MKKIFINGQFTNRELTGQERFAFELLMELDKIVDKNIIELIVPKGAKNIPNLTNIKIVASLNLKYPFWEQLVFTFILFWNRGIALNLCTISPMLKPGIVCIHDISYKVNPEYWKTIYGRLSKLWHLIQYNIARKFAKKILTVSEFSKKQIAEIYKVPFDKILVIGNGWEHFERINSSEDIFNTWSFLKEKPFFFSLGSLAPNKNIRWIIEVAKNHPQYNFIIAGNGSLSKYGIEYKSSDHNNIFFVGYISDEKVKSLMKNCKAFIFPSFYEGFGVPPLEALSVGAKIIISKNTCLPEIYGKSAYYINPNDSRIDLDKLLLLSVENPSRVLNKYNYKNSARLLWNELQILGE